MTANRINVCGARLRRCRMPGPVPSRFCGPTDHGLLTLEHGYSNASMSEPDRYIQGTYRYRRRRSLAEGWRTEVMQLTCIALCNTASRLVSACRLLRIRATEPSLESQ
jgi:hypothetical protein